MGRSPCCKKEGLNRGAWTAVEDKVLSDYIAAHGEGRWRSIPGESGLKRCGKSCRLRWLNYLRPNIKRGNITPDEEDLIVRLHNLLGNRHGGISGVFCVWLVIRWSSSLWFSGGVAFGRWSLIAGRLPGRTDNEIKNYWNTTLGKKTKGKEEKRTKRSDGGAKKPKPLSRSIAAVRTKATRCTQKVVLRDSGPEPGGDPKEASDPGNKGEGPPPTITEAVVSGKLDMDSSIEELLHKEVSNSDFWKFFQFDAVLTEDGSSNAIGNGNEDREANCDDLPFFEDTTTNCGNLDDFLRHLI